MRHTPAAGPALADPGAWLVSRFEPSCEPLLERCMKARSVDESTRKLTDGRLHLKIKLRTDDLGGHTHFTVRLPASQDHTLLAFACLERSCHVPGWPCRRGRMLHHGHADMSLSSFASKLLILFTSP